MPEKAPSASPAPAGFLSSLPIPVDPERIERELARMWKPEDTKAKDGAESVTRACLSNLIIDLSGDDTDAGRDTLLDVGRRFPSRMVILLRRAGPPPEGGSRLAAWVTAVCHRSAPGAIPVCCEQIILESCGDSLDIFRGAVLPLLVPDLPVVLVLSSLDGAPVAAALGEVADRVIFDSRRGTPSHLAVIEKVLGERPEVAADDLAWRACADFRWAMSDIFDEPAARPLLGGLQSLEVTYAPVTGAGAPESAGAAGAALLAGWLLSRLGWRHEAKASDARGPAAVLAKDGRKARVSLRPASGSGSRPGDVTSLLMESGEGDGGAHLEVSRAGGVLGIRSATGGSCVLPRTVALRARADADLIGEALEHTTHQGVFRAAVDLALRLG